MPQTATVQAPTRLISISLSVWSGHSLRLRNFEGLTSTRAGALEVANNGKIAVQHIGSDGYYTASDCYTLSELRQFRGFKPRHVRLVEAAMRGEDSLANYLRKHAVLRSKRAVRLMFETDTDIPRAFA